MCSICEGVNVARNRSRWRYRRKRTSTRYRRNATARAERYMLMGWSRTALEEVNLPSGVREQRFSLLLPSADLRLRCSVFAQVDGTARTLMFHGQFRVETLCHSRLGLPVSLEREHPGSRHLGPQGVCIFSQPHEIARARALHCIRGVQNAVVPARLLSASEHLR